MTTELEVSSTGNHRHFDEMIACSSLLSNAAHAYMNSSCQALLNSDVMQDDAALSSILHDYKLPYSESLHYGSITMHAQNASVRAVEIEGNSTLDYTRNNCNNVDSVSSNYYYHSAYSEPFLGGISGEELVDNMGETHNISWPSLPFNDLKANYQPHVYVNSCLMDDIMMNDNSLMSCLLSSASHDPQSFHLVDNPQPLSPLDLNHMHTTVNSSTYPLNVSQISSRHQLSEIPQVLCAPAAVAAPAHCIGVGQQALFDDGQFQDGMFVSALFADGSKEEMSEEYNVQGLQNSSCRGQMGVAMLMPSAFESNEGNKDAKTGSSPSSTCFGDSSHFIHQRASSLATQNPSNKRALMDGDQEGPPRKRLIGMTSPSRSDDVDQHEQFIDNAAPASPNIASANYTRNNINNNSNNNTDNNYILHNSENFDDANVDKNTEKATPASPNAPLNNMDKSKATISPPPPPPTTTNNNTPTPNKSAARGNNKQSTASDPQSIAARHRRERISERLKILQELVPNGSKVDIVTMLEKAINYVKFLQLQVKVLTTDEYWPNSQKLNQPNEMSLLNLIMSKTKNDSSSGINSDKALENTSKS